MAIGFTEIMVIFVCILLVFGPKRIPELAKAFGQASNELKKAKASFHNETAELINDAKDVAESKKETQ